MKTTTMCILSGLFGAMFAVACGAVSGVGDKVAHAAGFSKEVYEFSTSPTGVPNDYPPRSAFEDNPVWSFHYECSDGSSSQSCQYDGLDTRKVRFVFIY